MSGQDQRCGTCKWWNKTRVGWCLTADFDWGDCSFPIPVVPDCVFDTETELRRYEMVEHDGPHCPCWAPIENGEGGK